MALDANDNLWLISETNSLNKYSVKTDGTLSAPALSITGLTAPLAVDISPVTGNILVADGGNKQQLRNYSASGALISVYGQEGGYQTNTTVSNDKFYFNDWCNTYTTTFVCFQTDGSYWVGDTGNSRVMHFTADNKYVDQIMFLPKTYSCNVDVNNPKRVFANFLEFEVDYSKPLGAPTAPGNWCATGEPPCRQTTSTSLAFSKEWPP
ncbi:hypothetical protein [Spirosoma sp. KNUC1025]|uniref:hypothetical protein n=1 Tax=Spirosoma sp. KNUC1025 TaxID=2894082 RepID=UPI0038644130|nr:hypothetical protein LN737_22285 [Spirosoma sp. KNUC1025]